MATNGFTKCYNSIIFDLDLSLEAIGLYAKLKRISIIENFKIKRDYVKFISGYGETAFRRVWKELKDKNVLIENKTRNKGRYEYEFYLADEIKNYNNEEETKEVEKDKHVDSDGNTPIDGQIAVEDFANYNVKELEEKTSLKTNECIELLKCTGNDIKKVMDYYKYTLKQKNVVNVFKYVRACVMKKFKIPVMDHKPKGHFNNFGTTCL